MHIAIPKKGPNCVDIGIWVGSSGCDCWLVEIELAEQMGWKLPDAIFYPTGGGVGIIGMWKAFEEMEALGWIGSRRPKMIAVQVEGCQPVVRAFEKGEQRSQFWDNAHTVASGLRVPKPLGDFLILEAVRNSGGRL